MSLQNFPSNKRIPILRVSRFLEDWFKFKQNQFESKPSQQPAKHPLALHCAVQQVLKKQATLFPMPVCPPPPSPPNGKEHQTLFSTIIKGEELIVCSYIAGLEYC